MRIYLFLSIIIFLMMNYTGSASAEDDPFGIASLRGSMPQIWISAFDENVLRMGENKETFIRAFARLDSMEKKKAAVFLVAFMPLVDLVAMDENTFVNNINYAFKAREEFPWGYDYPDDIFYHYVLPHRVSQEPIEDFRPYFYKVLKERLKGIKTLADATLEVNKYADEVINYKPTQRRDQGPFETLKSGYGRCEEMMIFYMDAARSVGIPCRQAWTPYWAHCDDNHAWTEVWVGGKWYFLGSCEYAPALNEAWFTNPAKRAALVMSVPYGLPDKSTLKEELYRYEDKIPDKYAIINSTANYTTPGVLKVTVTDSEGKPLVKANVYIYVFNYGALRPIARLVTDENGMARITIGEGRFFVSGGDEKSGGGKLVNIESGKTKEVVIKPVSRPVLQGYNQLKPAKAK